MALCCLTMTSHAQLIDRIIAVVEDDVVLDSELTLEASAIADQIRMGNMAMPPLFVLRKQVLERIIVEKLQRQLAERSGIRISDEMVQNSVADIATRNNLTLPQFRTELANQGMDFGRFQETIRNEIIINQLRAREIGSRIKVTDREVAHYLETQGKVGAEKVKYRLGHILVALPEAASATSIQKARDKAETIIAELKNGDDFKQKAISASDGGNALKGGDLGWRAMAEMPTLFVDHVAQMNVGEISDPIRSPSGFHIIKMLEMQGAAKHMVTKFKVRHILVKTNELIDDQEAKKKLQGLKQRILDGDEFEALARAHSDDKGSALNGGSLGWVGPGVLVPPFEAAMSRLAIDEISEPVQTQFGWHMIQVLEKEEQDNSVEFKKNQVREEIRKRKIEEETELWLRRLRDEAYVDINMDRL